MSINTAPQRGMRDFSPAEMNLRTYVTSVILDIYRKFGFVQIETAALDSLEFLNSGQGGDNEKMLFKVLKRGEKLELDKPNISENDLVDLALRFDLTVPLTRFYANQREKLPLPFKVIQMGNVWRAERPQKGRFRQFVQCDIDVIGQKEIFAEIELILASTQALQALSFDNFTVKINDRRVLEGLAKAFRFSGKEQSFFIIFDKLDKIGFEGVEKELLENGFIEEDVQTFIAFIQNFSKRTFDEQLTYLAPILGNQPEILSDLKTVIETVEQASLGKFSVEFDMTLVRGMGYYTGQIFEVKMPEYGSSVAGGGRYDKMVGRWLKKEDVPACGFSIGFERIIQILEEKKFEIPKKLEKMALFFDSKEGFMQGIAQAQAWRLEGKIVSLEPRQKNFTRQLDRLAEHGFEFFAISDPAKPLEIKPLKKSDK